MSGWRWDFLEENHFTSQSTAWEGLGGEGTQLGLWGQELCAHKIAVLRPPISIRDGGSVHRKPR